MAASEQPRTTNGDRLRLGGMALENGLLVYGPNFWSAAVRDKHNAIIVKTGKVPRLNGNLQKIPGIRGVARLAEPMVVVPMVRAKLPQARLPFENPAVIGVAAATTALSFIAKNRGKRNIGVDAGVAMLGLAPALIALKAGNTAAYHGVEHKAIAAYEQGGDPNDPAVIEAALKEHERCGSHLVAPMLVASVLGEAIMRRTLENPGAAAQAGVALAGAGASIEMFAYAERHPKSGFAKIFRAPGFELQRALGTREPSAEQIEVGQAAIAKLLEAEGVTG